MLKYAIERYSIDINESWMVGDKVSDVQAGKNAGVSAAYIGDADEVDADVVTKDLSTAVEKILLR